MHQCDQIGWFLKCFGNKLSLSSSLNICQLFGLLLATSLLSNKTTLDTFSAALGKFGLLLIPASGHTVIHTHLNKKLLPSWTK